MGLLTIWGWDTVVPKVKPEGEQETPGCRLTGAVADKVKQGIRGEGAGGAVANTLEPRLGLKTVSRGRMGGRSAPGDTAAALTIGCVAMGAGAGGRCAQGARRLRDYSLRAPAGARLTRWSSRTAARRRFAVGWWESVRDKVEHSGRDETIGFTTIGVGGRVGAGMDGRIPLWIRDYSLWDYGRERGTEWYRVAAMTVSAMGRYPAVAMRLFAMG